MVKDLNTAQYAWCIDDYWCVVQLKHKRTRSAMMGDDIILVLSERKTNTTIKEVDYSSIIEMNRRISMQMTTPVCT